MPPSTTLRSKPPIRSADRGLHVDLGGSRLFAPLRSSTYGCPPRRGEVGVRRSSTPLPHKVNVWSLLGTFQRPRRSTRPSSAGQQPDGAGLHSHTTSCGPIAASGRSGPQPIQLLVVVTHRPAPAGLHKSVSRRRPRSVRCRPATAQSVSVAGPTHARTVASSASRCADKPIVHEPGRRQEFVSQVPRNRKCQQVRLLGSPPPSATIPRTGEGLGALSRARN